MALAIGTLVNIPNSQSRAPSLLGPRASAPPSPMVKTALHAGLPCTLMTLTLSVCHAWGNPTLTLRSAGLTSLIARVLPLCATVCSEDAQVLRAEVMNLLEKRSQINCSCSLERVRLLQSLPQKRRWPVTYSRS